MKILLLLLTMMFSTASLGFSTDTTRPITKHGAKWSIAYYETGQFTDYDKVFYAIVRHLIKINWIEKHPPLPARTTSKELWQWLSTEAKSNYLQFHPDNFYSSDWDDKIKPKFIDSLTKKLQVRGTIDFLWAAGTQSGRDFVNNKHSVPVFVFTASDPITAGLIKDENDHTISHAHVTTDPLRYKRQIYMFYMMTKFTKLGIIYEDIPNGRSYSGIKFVEEESKEAGFKVVKCHTIDETTSDQSERDASILACLNELTGKVDALYVTQQSGMNEKTVPAVIEWAKKNKILTFSQSGVDEVKQGILMSVDPMDMRLIGEFEAENMARVLNGVPVNEITQLLIDPPFAAVNMKTAKAINYSVPFYLMGIVEEVIE